MVFDRKAQPSTLLFVIATTLAFLATSPSPLVTGLLLLPHHHRASVGRSTPGVWHSPGTCATRPPCRRETNGAPSTALLASEAAATDANNNNNNNIYNPMVPTVVDPTRYTELLEWLASNGAVVNPALEVRKSSQGETTGYGVFVKDTVEEGDLLFSIPRELTVTLEKATTSEDDDGTFGKGMQTLIEKAGQGGTTVAMAGYMAKEYILMVLDEQDKRRGYRDPDLTVTENKWGPYMQLLPWKRGINNQEHILFWNEAKVEGLLKGSVCYLEAKSLREEVALSIQVLGPLLKRSVRMAKGDLSTSPLIRLQQLLPWEQFANDSGPDSLEDRIDERLIGDAIKGAFVTLLTRSFADDPDDDENETNAPEAAAAASGDDDEALAYEKLVPLLDILNHSDKPNIRHRTTAEGTVEVRARGTIGPDSELWNQYRSEEDASMPYSRFFTRFGFVPGIDEPIENLLMDESPIFYARTAGV